MPRPALPFEMPRVILTHYHDEGCDMWTWSLADENDWMVCESIMGFSTAALALQDARDAFSAVSAMGARYSVLFEDPDNNALDAPDDPALHALLAPPPTPIPDTGAFEPVTIPGEEIPSGDGFLVLAPAAVHQGLFGEDLED